VRDHPPLVFQSQLRCASELPLKSGDQKLPEHVIDAHARWRRAEHVERGGHGVEGGGQGNCRKVLSGQTSDEVEKGGRFDAAASQYSGKVVH
jgi:hypothetical protein